MSTGTPVDPPDSQLGETPDQFRARFVNQLKEDNFILYFQSIAPAASPNDSTFREVLVRYRDEETGLLPPGSFLLILEEQGLLPLLDRWVVSKLLKWGRGLQMAGKRMPQCSVNLSIDTMRRDAAFGEYVVRAMERAGVAPASLTFEVMTSDALAFAPQVAEMMKPLKPAGVTFALSWFNGEEQALDLAPRLGVSYLKLDPSLASNLTRDTSQQARLAGIVQRCRKMNVKTVAMWVENAETLTHLRAMQVDFVQGFGIAKPRPLEGT
jgi:EAL domain-containing protein (putative c-di-GMP-specific phosphodiesterase class I)